MTYNKRMQMDVQTATRFARHWCEALGDIAVDSPFGGYPERTFEHN